MYPTSRKENIMEIKDSGTRREFESGAVRDCAEGKGRCDLLPLGVLSEIIDDGILDFINDYVQNGDIAALQAVVLEFASLRYGNVETAILEVSKHFEEGAKKYAERNWELGINSHCYIDSAVRHYLKWSRGDNDEPHDRAFLWNIICACWTHKNKPEMIDLPFKKKDECKHREWYGDFDVEVCNKSGKVCEDPEECISRGDYE